MKTLLQIINTDNEPNILMEELNHTLCYVVFENSQEQDGLSQLSVTFPTLEKAREYVKSWKSKQLYIYLLVE